MDRLFNFGWISGSIINLLQMIKVVNINEYVVVVSGILAIVLLCLQIRSTWLKNKDLTKHIEKELLDIKDKTLDIDIKRKKNHIDGN